MFSYCYSIAKYCLDKSKYHLNQQEQGKLGQVFDKLKYFFLQVYTKMSLDKNR